MARNEIRFGYAGVRVRNLQRSLAFYRGLGFKIRRAGTMEHGGQWVHLAMPRQSQRLELNDYPPGNRFYEPFRRGTELDHLGFFVSDVDRWVRRSKRLGARVVSDFSETRERLAYVRDPDGIWVEFVGAPKPQRRR